MEINRQSDTDENDAVDALSHLALLERSKTAPEYEDFLNFGPRWHAPLYATLIGGMALWGAELLESVDAEAPRQSSDEAVLFVADTQIGFLLLGLISAVVLMVHAFRSRTVKAKPTLVGFLLTAVTVVTLFVVNAVWVIAISTVGYESFLLPWAPITWVLTIAFFLTLRGGLHRIRAGRRVAAV